MDLMHLNLTEYLTDVTAGIGYYNTDMSITKNINKQ